MILRARQFTFTFPRSVLLMGIVNVTPDSFSDGGKFLDADAAVQHALELIREGADMIDVGGESTWPKATPVSEVEELQRVLPVIEKLAGQVTVPISIDTMKPSVARAALRAGASIVNDVAANREDDAMWRTVAEAGAGYVAMHMQGTPQTMQLAPAYNDVVNEVADFFRQRYEAAVRSGIDPMCIAFDPGIGFGKTVAHNLELLANLPRLRVENRPLVVGVSKKSFLGKLSDLPADRASATVALTSLLRERGARVLRVHDVAPNAHALRITEALLAATR